jgi:hypothetical protein
MTASVICRVPAMAAVIRSCPSRRWRAMFSVTTMESSTSSPRLSTKPAMASWLTVKPNAWSRANPISSDSGIDSITTPPARKPSGSRVTSTMASARPKSRNSRESRCCTFSACTKPRSSFTPAGRVFSNSAIAASTPAVTLATSAPSFWLTVT